VTTPRTALLILAGWGWAFSPVPGAAGAPQEPSGKTAPPLAVDTPGTTVAGHSFIAPAGWTLTVKGKATILEAPEGDSRIVFVDVAAMEPDAAIQEAWAAYRPDAKWPLKSKTASSDKDGWTHQQTYSYQTSPNERRSVAAGTARHGDQHLVWIYDMSDPVAEKRGAQVALIFGRLFPKGYTRETFAGRKANPLDAARITELGAFVERAQKQLGVPGVSLGLVRGGRVVFAGGFGVRQLGKPDKPDADTLYIIASNTKAMTTLLLGRLVDRKKLTWQTPVTTLLPQFKLGDAETTKKVLVEHLVCACTGLPRQDFEWLLEFGQATPESALATLGTMQPTTRFGEMFQYSNPLAAAGGYVGAHVLFPDLELGAAYDRAMAAEVFGPLGMASTTFDFARALGANHASAHSLDIDGKPALAAMAVNYSIVPVRPAGGAWSSVNDLLKYVQMELATGVLPDGSRYVSEAVVQARREPKVWIGKDDWYGMGLQVDRTYGTPVVHHGGSMIGYKSDMLWLPEHGVGAVVLTNGDPGWAISGNFRRKLLEVLFDGKPEADNDVAAAAKAMKKRIAAERKLLTVPPDPVEVAKLAARYTNPALGEIRVARGEKTVFDFGEFQSEVASRRNPDGSVSFLTTIPGFDGLEFVGGDAAGKRTLVFRDAQHEYTFSEK
jgi:CubicO group peptidase (beta-lactamase class C family)